MLLALLGAGITAAAFWACGLLIFQLLKLKLPAQEHYPLAFLCGASLYSLTIFLLLATGLGFPVLLWGLAAAAIAICASQGAHRHPGRSLDRLPQRWRLIFFLGMVSFGLYYLSNSLAPETSPDGSNYHLGLVATYLRQHGFGRITTNMYANLPMGIEMLFVSAFSIGRHSAAATLHFLFLVCLAFTLLPFGRQGKHPQVGAIAALLVFLSPIFGKDASSAYIDVGMAAVLTGCFLVLQIWEREQDQRLLILVGLLAGFGYACKMTAGFFSVFAFLYVLFVLMRRRKATSNLVKQVAWFTAAAALMCLPWLIKNAIIVSNPFSPFLNELFPSPFIRISEMEYYSTFFRTYGVIQHWWQIPLEVTVKGEALNGVLGVVFLLVPLSLFALGDPLGRRALAAATFAFLPFFGNIGTRFLIGATPFFALALALVLCRWPGMAVLTLFFHAFASWPDVVKTYSDKYAWKFEEWRTEAALRIVKEEDYLARVMPAYRAAKMLEEKVPSKERVLSLGGIAQAYTSREILGTYEAGFNNMLVDLWRAPTAPEYLHLHAWSFTIPPTRTRKIRIVQTATSPQIWSISEVLIRDGGRETQGSREWRVRASPNPWDAWMGVDGRRLTRWKSWQSATPGMWFEVDFGRNLSLTEVVVKISDFDDQLAAAFEVEDPEGSGWSRLSARQGRVVIPKVDNARLLATQAIRSFGITYLAISASDALAVDMASRKREWGIDLIGEAGGVQLYRIHETGQLQ